jgi:hypothetical protein
MPVGFRDTLPSRLAKMAGRKVVLKPAPAPGYAELAPWLSIDDTGLRRQFVQRFASRLEDPQFRGAVTANMRAHPEWDPVLHPEKYAPKDPSKEAAKAQPGRATSQNNPGAAPAPKPY